MVKCIKRAKKESVKGEQGKHNSVRNFKRSGASGYYVQGKSVTYRQAQCLAKLTKGKTAKVIAQELGLSYRTVEGYITILKEKFDCCSRPELVQLVFKTDFLGVINQFDS